MTDDISIKEDRRRTDMLSKKSKEVLDGLGLVQFDATAKGIRDAIKACEPDGYYWSNTGKVYLEQALLKAGCFSK
jgi:hypothetical protein